MVAKNQVVVLVGPMGVGKTTIGKKLAQSLKLKFVDTDALVVKTHGEIADIFENHGEAEFRKLEEVAVAQALSEPSVVATGGGAVLSEATRELLKNATVIYLKTDGRHVKSRLRSGKRPLVKNGFDDWVRIYEARKPIYQSVADYTVDASSSSLSDTVEEIKRFLAN